MVENGNFLIWHNCNHNCSKLLKNEYYLCFQHKVASCRDVISLLTVKYSLWVKINLNFSTYFYCALCFEHFFASCLLEDKMYKLYA